MGRDNARAAPYGLRQSKYVGLSSCLFCLFETVPIVAEALCRLFS